MITSVSRYTRKRLLGWSTIHPERVHVLPNAIPESVSSLRIPSTRLRQGANNDKKAILTVGRLNTAERYKGHDRIIAAMPKVLSKVPGTTYRIIGEGDDRARLMTLAQNIGVHESIEFVGHVPQHELQNHYARAHVFAMPSTGEGFGIVFLEAAAAGLPVIGGNLDGSVDALAEGRIGRLINPNNQGDLVAALVDALTDMQPKPSPDLNRFAFANFARHVDGLLLKFSTNTAR
ncbi:MAG: hypothetical protein CTY31_02315 [Hyphomicrobium sp.]|nr:MAG: hypothetical protein CTY39_03850 [Hyphomicrobium sp.]PPD01965.1 MAG: hypothetical protein CTY31_02315 [Hyphomicrobium sp.]